MLLIFVVDILWYAICRGTMTATINCLAPVMMFIVSVSFVQMELENSDLIHDEFLGLY